MQLYKNKVRLAWPKTVLDIGFDFMAVGNSSDGFENTLFYSVWQKLNAKVKTI